MPRTRNPYPAEFRELQLQLQNGVGLSPAPSITGGTNPGAIDGDFSQIVDSRADSQGGVAV